MAIEKGDDVDVSSVQAQLSNIKRTIKGHIVKNETVEMRRTNSPL